jgi:hypothetical protein
MQRTGEGRAQQGARRSTLKNIYRHLSTTLVSTRP